MFTMRLVHLLWFSVLLMNIDGSLQQTGFKCTVPVIENGFVPGDRQEYDQDDILDYQCVPGHGRIDFRPSTCTKLGIRAEWSPTPVCERKLSNPDFIVCITHTGGNCYTQDCHGCLVTTD